MQDSIFLRILHFFARTREDTEQLHFFFILSLRDEPVLFAVLPWRSDIPYR